MHPSSPAEMSEKRVRRRNTLLVEKGAEDDMAFPYDGPPPSWKDLLPAKLFFSILSGMSLLEIIFSEDGRSILECLGLLAFTLLWLCAVAMLLATEKLSLSTLLALCGSAGQGLYICYRRKCREGGATGDHDTLLFNGIVQTIIACSLAGWMCSYACWRKWKGLPIEPSEKSRIQLPI